MTNVVQTDKFLPEEIILKNAETDQISEVSFDIDENTTQFDVYKGLIYMLISCIFRTTFSFLCKWTLNNYNELTAIQQITFLNYFYFGITLVSFFFIDVSVFSEKFVPTNKINYLLVRNALAIASLILVTYSLKYMHISDVFAIFFIYPVLVILFSICLLGEKAWWFDYLSCLASLVGVLLIVKPEFLINSKHARQNYYFVFLVVIAAILKSWEDIATRKIGKETHFQAFNFFYSCLGMLVFPLIQVYSNIPVNFLTPTEIFLFFLAGLCAYAYQTFATLAFQNEKAGRVSMINYLQVDFLYIVDLFVFNKPLIAADLCGILLIFSFNFANGLYKTLNRISLLNQELKKLKNNKTN
jgi:drug/metabolite transporter (DMT)-like permease